MQRFRFGILSALLSGVLFTAAVADAQSTSGALQIDISDLLNGRVVLTAQGGQLQSAQQGLDNSADSRLITHSAAAMTQSGVMTTLPDNDLIGSNGRHPSIQLHYARLDGQVHRIAAHAEAFHFEVPGQRYRRLQLFFISAGATTPLEVHLIYADGSNGKRNTTVPEFHTPPPTDDPRWFSLLSDLGTENAEGKATRGKPGFLHGFDLNPDPTKKLLKVEVLKLDSGSVLNFFAATGQIAESGHSKNSSAKAGSGKAHRKKR